MLANLAFLALLIIFLGCMIN